MARRRWRSRRTTIRRDHPGWRNLRTPNRAFATDRGRPTTSTRKRQGILLGSPRALGHRRHHCNRPSTHRRRTRTQKQEEANTPPGIIPLPEAGEETGGGVEEEGGGGGCTGMNACAASANSHHHEGVTDWHEGGNGYAGCSVWTSYGSEDMTSGISGEVEIDGHWECGEAVPEFVIQTSLLILNPENGKWEGVESSEAYPYFDVSSNKNEPFSEDFHCRPEHADYDAWVWGGQFDGSYHRRWWGWGREAEIRTSCHGGVSVP